jgi:hypothetical protein
MNNKNLVLYVVISVIICTEHMIDHKATWFWYSGFTGVAVCFHVIGVNEIAAIGGVLYLCDHVASAKTVFPCVKSCS